MPIIVDEMLPLLRDVIDDVVLVIETEVKEAIRSLAMRNKVVAEGSGALALAAASKADVEERGDAVCIVSGGSIDSSLIGEILSR